MEQYIERRQPNPQAATLASLTGWSPWRQSHRRRSNNAVDFMYDLYGVCNHMGSMSGGHYTGKYNGNSLFVNCVVWHLL